MKKRQRSRNHVELMLLFKVSQGRLNRSSLPKNSHLKGVLKNISLRKTAVPESHLIKCQAGGLQPYFKRDFDSDIFSCKYFNISSNIIKMPCWMKCNARIAKKEKIMLDEEKSCWMKI